MGITWQESFLGFIQAHIPLSSKYNPSSISFTLRTLPRISWRPSHVLLLTQLVREAEGGWVTRQRGTERKRGWGLSGSWVYLWLLPLCGMWHSSVSPKVQQAVVSQPVAQGSSHHGRSRPRGTWGSTPKHLQGGRAMQLFVTGILCAGHCVLQLVIAICWFNLWENPKMEELLLSPFHTWGKCCSEGADECPWPESDKLGWWTQFLWVRCPNWLGNLWAALYDRSGGTRGDLEHSLNRRGPWTGENVSCWQQRG